MNENIIVQTPVLFQIACFWWFCCLLCGECCPQ